MRGGRALQAVVVLLLCAIAARADQMAALERALASDPENLVTAAEYRQLAIAAAAFDRPIDFLERLAKRKTTGPNVHISLALAYVDKVPTSGDIRRLYLGRDAMRALTRSIERQPSPLAYYVRGVINLFYNNFIFHRAPIGIADLRQALTLVTPGTPPTLVERIWVALGDGYWRAQDRAKARETWKSALERFPQSAELKRRAAANDDEAAPSTPATVALPIAKSTLPAAPPPAACSENASRKMSANTAGSCAACVRMTISPPARYSPTFRGASFSAARPMLFTPPITTSHVSTAITTPEAHGGMENWLCHTTAMEFGCVKGVVVSAATPAIIAYSHASFGEPNPSFR